MKLLALILFFFVFPVFTLSIVLGLFLHPLFFLLLVLLILALPAITSVLRRRTT